MQAQGHADLRQFVQMVTKHGAMERSAGSAAELRRADQRERTAEAQPDHRRLAVAAGLLTQQIQRCLQIARPACGEAGAIFRARACAFRAFFGTRQGPLVATPEKIRRGSEEALGCEVVAHFTQIGIDAEDRRGHDNARCFRRTGRGGQVAIEATVRRRNDDIVPGHVRGDPLRRPWPVASS